MDIVLAGSRKIGYLPNEIKGILQDFIQEDANFLVGDAPGVDLSFQKFLLDQGCKNVTVFSSAGFIRNNVGNWESRQITALIKSKSSDMHAFKDREMCQLADLGLMVWDTESAGTLSNVFDLVEQGKECLIFNVPEGEQVRFDNPNALNAWCTSYPEVALEARKRLNRFAKRHARNETSEESQATLF